MNGEQQQGVLDAAQAAVERLVAHRNHSEVLRTRATYGLLREALGSPLRPGTFGQPAVKELELSGVLGSQSLYWEHRHEPIAGGFRPGIDTFRCVERGTVIVARVIGKLPVATEAEARLGNVRLAAQHCS